MLEVINVLHTPGYSQEHKFPIKTIQLTKKIKKNISTKAGVAGGRLNVPYRVNIENVNYKIKLGDISDYLIL